MVTQGLISIDRESQTAEVHCLTLTHAWMNSYIHCKMCAEIPYPSLIFKGATAEVLEWISIKYFHSILKCMWLLIHAGIRWQDVSQYLVSDFINQYGPKLIDLLTELRRQPNCFTVLTCATWQLRLCRVVARCGLLKQSSNLTVIPGPLNLFSAAYMIFPFLIQIVLSAGLVNIEKLCPTVKWLVPDVRTPATANPVI